VRRKDDRLWEAPVEENAQLVGEVVEDRLQVEPEPAVEHRPVARRPADLRADYLEEGEALRVLAAPHRLRDEAAVRLLHQLEGGETVEDRERALTDELLDSVGAIGAVAFNMRDGGEDLVPLPSPLARGDRIGFDVLAGDELAARCHAIRALELPADVFLQHVPTGDDNAA